MTSQKPFRRVASVLALAALVLSAFVVPAFAAGPSATASLAQPDRLVLANTTNLFEVTVTNTEPAPNVLGQGGGASINGVILTVSTAFADLGIDLVNVPAGWDAPQEIRSNQILFTTSGEGLAPGESAVFTLNSTIAKPATDKIGTFQVQVSSDGGQTSGAASPAGSGALQSVLRILDISRIQLVRGSVLGQPSVTDGQDNVVVAVDVNNHGSAAKTVVPTLSSTGAGAFDVTSAPAAASVPVDGTTTYTFAGTFSRTTSADVDNLTFDAIVDSADADAEVPDELRPTVAVQRAVALSYLTDTLSPRDVAAAPTDVTLSLNKAGVPSVSGLSLDATFTNGSATISPTSSTSTDVGPNGQTLSGLTFRGVPFNTPGLSDGDFTVEASAVGTDSNGAPIAIPSIPVSDTIFLDTLAPVLNLGELVPPASKVEGEDPAATNGQSFSLSGDVQDRGQGCPDCTVSGSLKIGTQDPTPFTVSVGPDGSFSVTIPVEGAAPDKQDTTAIATLTATDTTGVHSASGSRASTVDTLQPKLENTAPLTGGLAQFIGEDEDTSRIDVLFPEGIASSFDTSPANWSFQSGEGSDNLVTDATIRTAEAAMDGTLATGGPNVDPISFSAGDTLWFVELTLNTALTGNDEGTVTYEPSSRTGVGVGEATGLTRVFDRVNLGLPFGAQEIIDNIAPDLPLIGNVGGLTQQTDDEGEEKFFTNAEDGTFDVTITELQPGSYVELYKLEPGSSTPDLLRTSEPVSTDSHTFEGVAVGGFEREFQLFAVAHDNGIKASTGPAVITRLDRTAPEAVSATFDGTDTIRVVTNEGLVGTERSFDWFANATDVNGDPVTIFVNEVNKASETPAYDLRERDLTLDTSTYDASSGGNATLNGVVYDFTGSEGQLRDRAGNLFERGAPIPVSNGGGSGTPAVPGATAPASKEDETVVKKVTGLLGR